MAKNMNDAVNTILGIQQEIYRDYKNKTGVENQLIHALKQEGRKLAPTDKAEDNKENQALNQSSGPKTDKVEEMKESEKQQHLAEQPVVKGFEEFVRPKKKDDALTVQEKMKKLKVSETKVNEVETIASATGEGVFVYHNEDPKPTKPAEAEVQQITETPAPEEQTAAMPSNISHALEEDVQKDQKASTKVDGPSAGTGNRQRPQPSTMMRPQPTTMMTPLAQQDNQEALKKRSRATMDSNTDQACDLEDEDTRFQHSMKSEEGPGIDVKRKFFKNTNGMYLMNKARYLEKHNRDKFFRFIYMGKAMIDYATEGDLDNFKRLFTESDNYELMFWHVSKGFKAAVKAQRLNIVEFIIEELDMPMNNDAFQGYLHAFIFACQEAEMNNDELGQEVNRQVLRYMMVGYGKGNIDSMDRANGSTPLILACEYLKDLIIIEILVDGGADVNAVNNDNGMPLNIIKRRLKDDPENYDLQDIYEYLKRKGAVKDWKRQRGLQSYS